MRTRFLLGAVRDCALGVVIGIAPLLGVLTSEAAPPPGKRLLLFVGSNTLGERAIPELARAFLETQKHAKSVNVRQHGELIYVTGILPDGAPVYMEIHATGSGDCFKSFLGDISAQADIGMSSRRVKQEEVDAIKAKSGSNFFKQGREPGDGCEHPVGIDGIAIVVHKGVPISRISFTELRAIYSRKIVDWNQTADWKDSGVAERGLSILPIRRKEPSGTLDFFKGKIKPEEGPMNDTRQIPAFVSSTELVEKVAKMPGAIGFVGQSYAMNPEVKRLQVYNDWPPLSMRPEEAFFPDVVAVRQELYPISRVVYLYTPYVNLNPEVQPFLRFALGEEGQAVIAYTGSLFKVEGTTHEITAGRPHTTAPVATPPPLATVQKRHVILRLHGSTTVGDECAVNLAIDFMMAKRRNPSAPVENRTMEVETPEGEKALMHDVMCDLDGDGVPETIEIRPTGSSDAFSGLRDGICDIGMASRPISESERRDLISSCGDLNTAAAQFALGVDALAIVVSKENRVEKISLDQVRHVFLGEIKDWSELGGDKSPIQLYARTERSGSNKYFVDYALGGRSVSASARRHANSTLAAFVAEDPGGIGFVTMSQIGKARALQVGEENSEKYYSPTSQTVRSGKYPPVLCRFIYLYVPVNQPKYGAANENWPAAREFAEMSQSWRGQIIVANSGFVTELAMTDEGGYTRRREGEEIQQFLRRLKELEKKVQLQRVQLRPRLSEAEICPRLLFDYNSTILTAESQNIIDRKLGPWLKIYPSVAKAGLIAEGWSDSAGTDEICRRASLKRAETVAKKIADALKCSVKAVGMGKSFELSTTSEANKQQSRRVVMKAAGNIEPPRLVGEASPAGR